MLIKLGQAAVERLECRRVARDIAAVAKQRIEIDKIGKNDGLVRRGFYLFQPRVEKRLIAVGFD